MVSGLLTINVRHSENDNGENQAEMDTLLGYVEHPWADDPNGVPETSANGGQYPFYYDDSVANRNPPKYPNILSWNQTSATGDGRYYLEADDPNDSGAGNNTVPKELSLGDYDCFLFYVVCAAHLEDKKIWWDTGPTKKFHHNACQSFIKSHLISRINNAVNCDHTSNDDYTMFKRGHPRSFNRVGSTISQIPAVNSTVYVFSEGTYQHQMSKDGEIDADNLEFGIDLEDGNNTFFTPVESIEIGIAHPGPDPTLGTGHDPDSYGLSVRVHLYALASGQTFTRNRINVLWQPFGEMADFVDP